MPICSHTACLTAAKSLLAKEMSASSPICSANQREKRVFAALIEIVSDYLAGGIRQPARRAAVGGEMGGGFGGGLRLPENMNKAVTTLIASKCRLLSVSQKLRFS